MATTSSSTTSAIPCRARSPTYIEIQNSPTDRRLQWGDPGYAKSRFKGFLWSVVYSTHSEISPAGEAGVGNEGGFTYPTNCLYQSFDWPTGICHPGTKYTNNTGWVDFIITPTVGMVWVVAEDVIDRYVTKPMVLHHPTRFWPLVVRSGLSPSRSFANMLRWKVPWYRDYEEPIQEPNRVYWFPSKEVAEYRALPRVQLSPFWNSVTHREQHPHLLQLPRDHHRRRPPDDPQDPRLAWLRHLRQLPSQREPPAQRPRRWQHARRLLRPQRQQAMALLRSPPCHAPRHDRVQPGLPAQPGRVSVLASPPRVGTTGGNADGLPYPGVTDANGTPNEPPSAPSTTSPGTGRSPATTASPNASASASASKTPSSATAPTKSMTPASALRPSQLALQRTVHQPRQLRPPTRPGLQLLIHARPSLLLDPLFSPRRRLKRIRKILRLVHHLAVAKLHDAHRKRGLPW